MDKKQDLCCRKNRVGGQAVIEGVMMKKGEEVALAVRKDDGTIEIEKSKFIALKTNHKWLNIPIIRGVVGFFESMVLSFKTLGKATDMLGIEEEEERLKAEKKAKKEAKKKAKAQNGEPAENDTDKEIAEEKAEGKAEKKDTEKEEKKTSGATTVFIMAISLILGLALALFLFSYLPTQVTRWMIGWFDIDPTGGWHYALAAIEGGIKVLIFIAYLVLVSLMKDIRRTFQYHGAEHKSIACFKSGMDLTPENAKKCTRYHPRCGTSFMFVMILLGVIIGMFIPNWGWVRVVIKIAILPLIMGLGYEFIMLAGKHENWLTKALSAPGLWMQRITTREPDEYQLAIAICAIKATMPEEFPDFDPSEYFITREQNKGHICYDAKLVEKEKAEKEEKAQTEQAEEEKEAE
ncbi:MAG: DUF1385 domain-containing protein [Clostridia bacterium]|nr:DUF1385 domain-containing protein [Clostridia bacterium]